MCSTIFGGGVKQEFGGGFVRGLLVGYFDFTAVHANDAKGQSQGDALTGFRKEGG